MSEEQEQSKEQLTRTARNSAWLLAGQTVAQALTLAFTVLVARSVGIEAFGQYAFGAAVASFLTIAAAFGLDLVMIRDMSRDPTRTAKMFSTAIIARLLLWTVGLVPLLCFIVVRGGDGETARVLLLLGLAGLMTILANCGAAVMASRELFWPRVVAETIGSVLRVILAYGAVRAGFGIVGIASGVLVASVLAASLSLGYALRRFRLRPILVPWRDIMEMLRRAAPFGAAGLVFSLYFRLHVVMLSVLRGDVEVGLYGAAFKAVDAWMLIPGSLMGAAYPVLSRSFGKQDGLFERTTVLLGRGLLAISLPAAVLVAVQARELMALVYGDAFVEGHRALAVLAPMLPLVALNYLFGSPLYAAGRARLVLRVELTGLLVGLGSGLVLIPTWGVAGAAAAALIMSLTVATCLARAVRRQLGFSATGAAWWPALPAALAAGALCTVLALHVLAELTLGLILFTMLFLWLGGVRGEDRRWLAANVTQRAARRVLARLHLLADDPDETGMEAVDRYGALPAPPAEIRACDDAAATPRVAFVLVNWNTRELLLDCLRRLQREQDDLRAEVVVIDNASTDGSAAAVANVSPPVRLIRNRANVGFARAVNQGIRVTTAPLVCLLNPDLKVEGRALDSCLQVMEGEAAIGALGPLVLRADGGVQEYCDRHPTALGMIRDALSPRRAAGHLSPGRRIGADLFEVDWLVGACLLLRRSALDRVGLLDERFFLYCEDMDLCLRMRRGGYRVARHHGARLRHLIAQSTRTNPGRESDRADIEGMRSTVLYARKQKGASTAALVALALRISLLPRLGKAALLHALTRRERERRKLDWMRTAWWELDRPTPETRHAETHHSMRRAA